MSSKYFDQIEVTPEAAALVDRAFRLLDARVARTKREVATPKPHTLRRLDCPKSGRPVYYLGPAGDGYARVESLNRQIRWETLESRLHKPLN